MAHRAPALILYAARKHSPFVPVYKHLTDPFQVSLHVMIHVHQC